jgi:ribosomal protein L21E
LVAKEGKRKKNRKLLNRQVREREMYTLSKATTISDGGHGAI